MYLFAYSHLNQQIITFCWEQPVFPSFPFLAQRQWDNFSPSYAWNSYLSRPPFLASLCRACCAEYTNSSGRGNVHFKVREIWTGPLAPCASLCEEEKTEPWEGHSTDFTVNLPVIYAAFWGAKSQSTTVLLWSSPLSCNFFATTNPLEFCN